MPLTIEKISSITGIDSVVYLITNIKYLSSDFLSGSEIKYIENQIHCQKRELLHFQRASKIIFIQFMDMKKETENRLEILRKSGDRIAEILNKNHIKNISISDIEGHKTEVMALVEGISLGNYQFLNFKTKKSETKNPLKKIRIRSNKIQTNDIDSLMIILESVYKCRDLVNYPVSALNATKFAEEVTSFFEGTGIKTEVLTEKKIQTLKMGGLLGVNKGSVDPPTFTIIEWKPEDARNSKPYILVGKGVMYDTGGMNLKIHDHMNNMKADMSGAAAVAASLYGIARLNIPLYIIGLIPATDNRVDGNAIVPGDVIHMHDGSTVEIINTDAEGRLILADALSYAKKYEPELVIDLATLTGSAMRALGINAIAGMQKNAKDAFGKLVESSYKVHERIVELPLWDDFNEDIKSDIADIKNLGGANAGAITAGKFLEHFTDYPFIHLDIAGPAFYEKKNSYFGTGGSGYGVRLLINFFQNLKTNEEQL